MVRTLCLAHWLVLCLAACFCGVTCSSLMADGTPGSGSAKTKHAVALAKQAYADFRHHNWAKAAGAFEQLLEANPDNGQHWSDYGFALHSLKRHDEAIRAWNRSIELGFNPAGSIYNICCAHCLAGRKDEAIATLQKAIDAGFNEDETIRTDTDLDSLRSDGRFKKIVSTPPEGLSRDERWRFDLNFLVRRMEKVHFNLYAKVTRERFQAAIDKLKARVATLSDDELAVGVQELLALVGDGHTLVAFRPRNDGPLPRYPVEFYLFKEGLFIRSASAEQAGIVGSKVLKIGNATVEDALAAVGPLCSRDNTMGVKLQSPVFLTNPAALSYLKIANDARGVALRVRKPDGTEATVELKPVPVNRAIMGKFVKANELAKTAEPISFKGNEIPFWMQELPERNALYVQFNAVADTPHETLEKFSGRVFRAIDDKRIENLILDMRNNGGGNTFLYRALVHGLIRCKALQQPGHFFVLVGRRTFSAAMNCTVDIERNTNAIFVGEPTGSRPNFVGESTILTLPCSKLRFSCSSLYWQRAMPMDHRVWIAPQLSAPPSIEAFAANRDPGLEAIFAYVESQPRSSRAEAAANRQEVHPSASTGESTKKGGAESAASLRRIVEACNRRVIEDFKKGDMAAVARSYADDATIYFAPGKKIHGREAIDRFWLGLKGAKDWKLETIEVDGTADAIYEIGKSTLTTQANGADSTYVCDYVVIWKRQKDGSYRTYTDIYN